MYTTGYSPEADQVVIDRQSIRWVENDQGPIKIYEEPRFGEGYIIGADTAGEGSDYNVGQVLHHQSGKQVCVIRGRMDEDLFAKQLYCLGYYYNTALVSIEANFSSYPIRELERLRYPRQYVRQVEDSFTHRTRQSYGFKTSSVTRPLVIAGLVEVVREHPDWICDKDTLHEMLSFVRNENGRPEAQRGAHDDCVMALAIGYFTRDRAAPQQEEGDSSPFVTVGKGPLHTPWKGGGAV